MRTSKYSPEQIAQALRQVESGTPDVRELRQLREENRKLKQLVADLSLDKTILRESLKKKW